MKLTQVRNATLFIEYAGTTFLIDPMLAANLHYSLGNHEIYILFEEENPEYFASQVYLMQKFCWHTLFLMKYRVPKQLFSYYGIAYIAEAQLVQNMLIYIHSQEAYDIRIQHDLSSKIVRYLIW